jgi:SAM-dependent methyltransferase
MLWNTEMYGLEISKWLAVRGIDIRTSQLYPALNHLEKIGALKSREAVRAGATRRYYETTTAGREMVMHSLLNFFFLFEDMIVDSVFPVIEKSIGIAQIHQGMVVVDFSSVHYDRLVKMLTQQVAPSGRCLLVAHSEILSSIFHDRIEYYAIENSTILVRQERERVPIPDHSVDVALLVFTLHEDGTEWTVKEMARVLKPSGVGIVVDALRSSEESIVDAILEEFVRYVPRHSRYMISSSEVKHILEENALNIRSEERVRGIAIFQVEPKNMRV